MRKILLYLLPALLCGALLVRSADDPFIEKPYLQLGDRPKGGAAEALSLLWHAAPESGPWKVQLRSAQQTWRDMGAPAGHLVAMPGAPPHQVYRAELTGLTPGAEFEYRVLRGDKDVFS